MHKIDKELPNLGILFGIFITFIHIIIGNNSIQYVLDVLTKNNS